MLKLITKSILLLGFLLTAKPLTGQDYLAELSEIYADSKVQLDSAWSKKPERSYQAPELFSPDQFYFDDYALEILDEEFSTVSDDWGLNFLTSYVRNYGEGLNDERENFTRDRLVMELQWNLLSGGYKDGKIKSRLAENEMAIHKLERNQYLKSKEYGLQYNGIIYLFNKAKLDFLQIRLGHLKQQERILNELYLSHLLSYTDVLAIRKKIARCHLLIKDYRAFNDAFKNITEWKHSHLDAKQWPVYHVAIHQLIGNSEVEHQLSKRLEYQNQNALLRSKLDNDIKLRVFARRTYTAGGLDGFNRNFNSLGVAVNVPIQSLKHSRNKLSDLRIKQNTKEYEFEVYHRKKELLNHYYEYDYKLQQYQQMQFDAKRMEESIRKHELKGEDSAFYMSKIRSLELLNERADIEFELIDLKQQLYLKLLKIQSLSEVEDIYQYLIPGGEIEEEKLVGKRIVRLVLADIETYGMELITAYLKNSQMSRVVTNIQSKPILGHLKNEGFEMNLPVSEPLESIDPKLFESKVKMEEYICALILDENVQHVVIEDLSALIQLELKTINNQHQ